MPESFGADQEAYVTLVHVDPNGWEQDLLLKESDDGLIEVLYDAEYNDIGVWTYSDAQGWVRHGDYIPVAFNDGDQFGARAKANGEVEVYKNGTLLATRNVSSWPYYAGGGRIGIWFVDVTGALLDDFGGGNISDGEGLMAQGNEFIESASSEGGDLLERLQTNPKPTRSSPATNTPTLTTTPPQSGFDLNPIANLVPVSLRFPIVPAPLQQSGPVTIDYVYDPLYRLTEANYSTGDYYHYTYDAVGNRLLQDTFVGGLPSSTAYLYDDANRLTSVNGVPYAWDANGNLLSDGTNTYTYDSANRLISFNGTMSYAYNGLGDRLSQNRPSE